MSYKDFLRAMTPYCRTPFFSSTDDYLKSNTPEILQKVDVDGDGRISFAEFFFFLVLLQTHPAQLRIVFKHYSADGNLPKCKASSALRELRAATKAGSRQTDQASVDARAVKATEADFAHTTSALVEVLFKDKDVVSVRDILDLQKKLHEDLWHYQFYTLLPNEEGHISTENFLKSNLPSLSGYHLERHRRRIAKISKELEGKDPGVSLEQFIAMQYFFEQIDVLKAKVAHLRYLDYATYLDVVEDFYESEPYCLEHSCMEHDCHGHAKTVVPEHITKSLFNFLDTNESGKLDLAEIRVFQHRVIGLCKVRRTQ